MPNKKNINVYVGSSLGHKEAQSILPNANFLPPIKRGDLDQIKNPKDKTIVIIDGSFHQTLAVSIAEVRAFMKKGGTAYGASSMGALRATELEPLGMIGIGTIYEQFKSGKLNSDEDVALTFNPETGEAQTITTVHVRHVLKHLRDNFDFDSKEIKKALHESKKIYYVERSLKMLMHVWSQSLSENLFKKLEQLMTDKELDPKRKDAIQILTFLNQSEA